MPSLPQFEAVFNSSPTPTALFSTAEEPVFVAVNDAFVRTSTRSREELVGAALFEVVPATPEDPEGASAAALRASIAQAIASGAPQTMPAQRYPIKVRQPDGAEMSEERYWNAVNAPVRDADGHLLYVLHQTYDITPQVKAQAQQRETTELYSTLIESMDDGFCIVDIQYDEEGRPWDYRFLDVNRAFEAQTGLLNARGKSVRQLVPETDTRWAEMYSRVALTGEPLRLVEDSSPIGRWFDVYATRVADPKEGKVAVLFSDVTASRRAKNELRALAADLAAENRRKTEFLATLAHELRNPLAPIRTGLDLLRMTDERPPAAARIYTTMERQLTQLVRLIDDLLDIARINSGKVALRKERIALRDVIATAIEASEPLIRGAGHRLAVSVPEAPVPLDADPVRLAQILGNLLANAAKYTPPGGRIDLAVQPDAHGVEIAVGDTGIGIPQEALAEVFDMFSQVSRDIGRAQGGLGIGLSLVRSLAEMHGGSVRAESAGPGKGSTFTVRLPLAPDAAAAGTERKVAAVATPPAAGRPLRILVADDNVDAAQTIVALLETGGHRVDMVHRGRQALEKARSGAYDLAILDIGMPDMDGHQVAQALRATPGCEKTYLAALTGWGAEDDRARSRAAGFDAHLTKPAGIADIRQLVLALTGGAGADT